MTDREEMYNAFLRDRRRLIIVFVLVLAVVGGTLGTGWVLSAMGRDTWASQALVWQERYIELYDEFTAATGETPEAPQPDEVAEQGPQGEPGDPGPPGPIGPSGESATDAQVLRSVVEYCAGGGRCVGPAGEDSDAVGPAGPVGAQGEVGPRGEPGATGPAGAVGPAGPAGAPGPAGPQGPAGATGPAGPLCPSGYTAQTRWVYASAAEGGLPAEVATLLCLPAPVE